MREIAIRGFINEKFNTTFGKGLFRRAVYNGSVELHDPNQKYLVDYIIVTGKQIGRAHV